VEERPDAAVRHTFHRIAPRYRVGLVRSHPTYVLNHYLDKLTERELEVASSADAATAFQVRHFLVGRRHAIVLARSYPAAFFIDRRGSESELAKEVTQSFLEYPRIWHRLHCRSFGNLFRCLDGTLCVQFKGEGLLRLLKRLRPKLRKQLLIHIASNI
jgi:hypothetical protein